MNNKTVTLSENYREQEAAFFAKVKTEFGSRGLKEAKAMLQRDYANMSTDERMNSCDCECLLIAFQDAFLYAKQIARLKFTPKKFRKVE